MAITKNSSLFSTLKEEGMFATGGRALDLGCGKGLDARNFAKYGFKVDTVDKMPADQLEVPISDENISYISSKIEEFIIAPNTYNLVSASFSLQFLSKENAKKVITAMVAGCLPGGVVIFNLIGERDDWANNGKWSIWNKQEALDFIAGLPVKIRNVNEYEGIGNTIQDGLKKWHIFEFVLVK